ncbi:MAG: D-aminoacyl-tRNA deacylase [Candidatus Tectimicrobiota bacterium]
MRAVVQRVREARVEVGERLVGRIDRGLVVLLGVGRGDTDADADYLARKIVGLRIFDDEAGFMNRSLEEVGGAMLVVSQFTLYADSRKGRRPFFGEAAEPGEAERLYEYFVERVRAQGVSVATGAFKEMMDVTLTNEGPVTILLDSADKDRPRRG